MFGEYILINKNNQIDKVDFQIKTDSYFKSANGDGLVIVNTLLAKVYINDDSYFGNVPESAWKSTFEGELSPEAYLKSKIGKSMSEDEILEFQKLLEDLLDAEFRAKNK